MFEGLRHDLCHAKPRCSDVDSVMSRCPCALGQKFRLGLSLRDAAQEQEGAE